MPYSVPTNLNVALARTSSSAGPAVPKTARATMMITTSGPPTSNTRFTMHRILVALPNRPYQRLRMSRAPRRHRSSRQSARRLHSVLGGGDFDHFACRRWRWNALTALSKVVEMEFDGFTDQCQRFITRVGRRNAPWKVGNVSAKRRRSFLNNNEVAHYHLLLLETRLLQDAIKGARRHVGSGIASNRNGTRFRRMVKLAMTPGDAHLHPSVRLNQGNEFTDLHRQSLPSSLADFDTQSRGCRA